MRCAGDTGGLGEGTIIDGKYPLTRKLSEGASGAVWLSHDSSGAPIALKILKWSPLKSKELATERFKNEFAIFKTLAHPNIARIYDFGHDHTHHVYYFTSELLTEGDLRTYIKLPVEKIEPLLLQALRSLEYLRNAGLLHLDIKPQNFLLRAHNDAPQLVLIDFGLATFHPPDKPGGTANYMPPEVVARRLPAAAQGSAFPEPDHRSDLYSLGVTFYQLLTGIQPYAVLNPDTGRLDTDATLRRHLELTAPPPPSHHRPDVPHYLDTIVMKLMALHPDDRYPAAAVAAQALRYRSPRELEPENRESLLAYLPTQGKMIGRASECDAAEAAATAIAERTPHAPPILIIAGPRGTGRTRLLEHLKPLAQRLEMDVHLIAAALGGADELAQLSVAGIVEPHPRAILIDDLDTHLTATANTAMAEAFLTPLKELIHRAHRTQRLSQQAAPPLFIVCALNTDNVALPQALAALDIEPEMAHIIELANFSVAEVGDYLASLLGEECDHEAAHALHRLTQGNPLFITEQLERMIADGHLFSLAGRPDASTLEAIGLDFAHLPPPQSLTASTLNLLKKLPPPVQHLAALMACWSEPIHLHDLRATFALEGLESALMYLVATDLIHKLHQDSGRYTFTNEFVPAIIETHLAEEMRASLHTDIAAHLERYRPKDRAQIDLHRARGTNKALRLRALERLAQQAEDDHRPHEAAEYLELLFSEIPSTAYDLRADVLVRLGRAYEWAYHPDKSHEAFKRLMQLKAPRDKAKAFKIRAHEQIALSAIRRREMDEARRALDEALKTAGTRSDALATRLRLENFLAGIDLREGRADQAVEKFAATARRSRALAPEVVATITNNELGEALLQAGRYEEAHAILSRELGEAEAAHDLDRICARHFLLGNLLSEPKVARYDEAQRHYDQAFVIARQRRLLRLQVRLYNSVGNLKLRMNDLKEAIAHYRKGLGLSEQIDSKTTSVELMVGLGLAHARTGEIDASVEYFEAALDFASGPKGAFAGIIKRFAPTIYVHLGDLYYRKKEYDRAERYLGNARELDAHITLPDDVRYSIYGTFAEIYADKGELDAARRMLPTLEKIAAHFPAAKEHLAALERRLSENSSLE